MFEGTEREIVFQEIDVLAQGRRPDHRSYAFELAGTRPNEAPDVGDQVERHLDHDAVLGRALSRDGRAAIRTSAPTSSTSTSCARTSCSGRRSSTSSSHRTCSATSLSDLGSRGLRDDRHRAVRQHQSGAHVSVTVRAGSRFGARHRGQGHRQPDRTDLVGRADARLPRPSRRRRARSSPRSNACWPTRKHRARPTSGAAPRRPNWDARSPRRCSVRAALAARLWHDNGKATRHAAGDN